MRSFQVLCVLNYSADMANIKDKKIYRKRLVDHALTNGIKPAMRHFKVARGTVRKWLKRYNEGGYDALADTSHAPKHPANGIEEYEKVYIIYLKKRHPSMGAKRLKLQYYESMSLPAIRKIFREAKLIKLKRKKPKTKQSLREVKKEWALFEQSDVDLKELKDIPEYWPYIQRGFADYQYTFREVTSGLQFTAYANEKNLAYANLFMQILLQHFTSCGVKLEGGSIQTDNGSEFIGSWNKKGMTAFTETIEVEYKMIHKTIPCSAHTWQSDVETVHRLIEDEFFEVEGFSDRRDFLEKVGSYLLWFNTVRKNSYKENQTPWEIVKQKCPKVSPQIVNLPPFYLDELFDKMPDETIVGGHHLINHPSINKIILYTISRIFSICNNRGCQKN